MSFGAIFDWDGVIIDSSAQHERSWELLSDKIGKPLPEGHFKRGFGKKNECIIPDLGWATAPDEIHQLGLRKEELYRDGVTPLPGARELLTTLSEAVSGPYRVRLTPPSPRGRDRHPARRSEF